MTTMTFTEGERYEICYRSRDIGYGVEEGSLVAVYEGRESFGKLTFVPVDASPTLYLFEDEIVSAEPNEAPTDVWGFQEEAPVYASDVADLWHWSTNYDAGKGPFTLFLDLIGWSEDNIGETLYDLTSASLGYVELSKLADALKQYTERPQGVRVWVDELLTYDEA